ncbi:hypothetical protein DFS34DRAFT_622409 [Phlyctochytrium arcticum]|nr:hypothetical protein DFS34DRAFT_622409 [Phlyctochytrium arcticum]
MVAFQELASLLPIAASVFSSGQTTSASFSNVVIASRQNSDMPKQCSQGIDNTSCDGYLGIVHIKNTNIDAKRAQCLCPHLQTMSHSLMDKECMAYLKKQTPDLKDIPDLEGQLAIEMTRIKGFLTICEKGDYEAAAKELNDQTDKLKKKEEVPQQAAIQPTSGGPKLLAIGHWFMVGTAVAITGAVLGTF